jgi:hypothetical protein
MNDSSKNTNSEVDAEIDALLDEVSESNSKSSPDACCPPRCMTRGERRRAVMSRFLEDRGYSSYDAFAFANALARDKEVFAMWEKLFGGSKKEEDDLPDDDAKKEYDAKVADADKELDDDKDRDLGDED